MVLTIFLFFLEDNKIMFSKRFETLAQFSFWFFKKTLKINVRYQSFVLVEICLRFQNTILNFRVPHGIISSTFKIKIFFCLTAFLSQHLNYFVIIIWTVLNFIDSKNNPIVVHFFLYSNLDFHHYCLLLQREVWSISLSWGLEENQLPASSSSQVSLSSSF